VCETYFVTRREEQTLSEYESRCCEGAHSSLRWKKAEEYGQIYITRVSTFIPFTNYYYADLKTIPEMGGVCSTSRQAEKHIQNFSWKS
jgi:hypothetical protein